MDFEHVALIKFPRDLTPDEVGWIDGLLGEWPTTIGGMRSLRWGFDVSGRAQGYTFGIVITFESAEAAEAYQPHPRHQEFAQWARSVGGDVLVVDLPGEPERLRT
jgi:hypothetical protein